MLAELLASKGRGDVIMGWHLREEDPGPLRLRLQVGDRQLRFLVLCGIAYLAVARGLNLSPVIMVSHAVLCRSICCCPVVDSARAL